MSEEKTRYHHERWLFYNNNS